MIEKSDRRDREKEKRYIADIKCEREGDEKSDRREREGVGEKEMRDS